MTNQTGSSIDPAPVSPTERESWQAPEFTVIPVSESANLFLTSGNDGTAHTS